MPNNKLTYIDLFAGAGGLSEGFIREDFFPVAHVEKDSYACQTLTTRSAYHYLKENNKLDIYYQYLKKEIDRETLYKSIPNNLLKTVINEEITEDTLGSIFEHINKMMEHDNIDKVDLIIGGPPCQAYSIAGRVAIVNDINKLNDPRRFLYKLYIKFLDYYKPKVFVFENVPGILSAKDMEGELFIYKMKKEFKEVGYEIEYKLLDATDYGVLQKRKRIFIIGWQEDISFQYPTFDKEVKEGVWNVYRDILADLPKLNAGEIWNKFDYAAKPSNYLKQSEIRTKDDILTQHITRPNNTNDLGIYKLAIQKWFEEDKRLLYDDVPAEFKTYKNLSQKGFQNRFSVVEGNKEYTHTMIAHIAQDGHYYIHPDITHPRSISVREAARIQSFPDNYFFEGPRTRAFTQIGNAVPPLVGRAIARKLKELL